MIQSVEEAANVQIQPPVHLPARDPSPDRIQRIMLAAAGAKAIAEAQEVLLINLAQDPRHRLLDDLVLQRCDAQRSLPTVRLGYPATPRGLRTVPSALDPIVEVRQPGLQLSAVLGPRHAVQPRGRLPPQREVCLPG